MKKYLLAVLALGATMMMACEPANKGGDKEVTPDYVLDATSQANVMATLDNAGDDAEVGTNVYMLQIMGMTEGETGFSMQMLAIMYTTELTELNGCGVFTPDTIEGEAYTFAPNLFQPGYQPDPEDPSYVEGSMYGELEATATGSTEWFEPVVGGKLTVTYNPETEENTFAGLLTLGNGKVLKVDYTGLIGGGIAPLKASLASEKVSRAFSSVLKLKK